MRVVEIFPRALSVYGGDFNRILNKDTFSKKAGTVAMVVVIYYGGTTRDRTLKPEGLGLPKIMVME
jgi:hypothetical protein